MAFQRTLKVDPDRERKAQPPKALSNIPGPVVRVTLASFISIKDLANLSSTCFFFHTNTQSDKRVDLRKLLEAAVDEDQAMVTTILSSAKPERLLYLLTTEPAAVGIPEIKSKFPWRIFKTKKVFEMIQLLKKPKMTALLLSYLDKLEEFKNTGEIKKSDQTEDDRPERIKQWVLPSPLSEIDQAIMQDYYIRNYFRPLIETLAADTTIHTWSVCLENKYHEVRNISPKTILAVDGHIKKILPDRALDLDKLDTPNTLGRRDNYVDIEQFLIAACRAYHVYFDTFQNWDQRYAYSIFIIRPIMFLVPEDGRKFVEGQHYSVVQEPIYPFYGDTWILVARLQFKDEPTYRAFSEILYRYSDGRQPWHAVFGKLCQAKAAAFGELTRRVHGHVESVAPDQQSRPGQQSCCVIS